MKQFDRKEKNQDNHVDHDLDHLKQSLAHYKTLYYDQQEDRRAQLKEMESLRKQVQDLSEENKQLHGKINRLKSTIFWKLIKPFKKVVFLCKKAVIEFKHNGIKGVIKKTKNKLTKKSTNRKFIKKTFLTPEEETMQKETKFPRDIKISILVPLYNTPKKYLNEMIDSVVGQTYGNWELCLADGSDSEHAQVRDWVMEYAEKDSRIKYNRLAKNLGISGNTNACIEMATGDYIALFDHDDVLHPGVLYEVMKEICEKDADFVYTDEATFEGNDITNIITFHFKPDFAIDNLRANNYICHFSVFKASLLEKAGLFRDEYNGSQDHDMILRLTSVAKNVCHIPKLLYYWRSHPASVASDINSKSYAIDAGKRAVEDHLKSFGLEAKVESSKAFPTIFRIHYKLKSEPMVSILIPNKDHVADLTKCIDSILDKSTYTNYEIIIIENNSKEERTFAYYRYLENYDNIRIVKFEHDFNYAAINNYGAGFAKGEYLLLLNNDTEVITPEWIEEMLMYGQRDDVGAVGAKLYYNDDTIQHAGVVIGLGAHRAAGHSHYRVAKENLGYMGRLYYAQNLSAVTGACLLVKKSLYDELNGLDEKFTVAFNDVDFCLQIRQKNLLVVFTPYAELYHYESKSRGFEDTEEKKIRFEKEVKLFRDRWKDILDAGDPYYNPNFSLDSADFTIRLK